MWGDIGVVDGRAHFGGIVDFVVDEDSDIGVWSTKSTSRGTSWKCLFHEVPRVSTRSGLRGPDANFEDAYGVHFGF